MRKPYYVYSTDDQCNSQIISQIRARDRYRPLDRALACAGKDTHAICDIETAVRSDMLCQLALIAVKQGRKLRWDPKAERFVDDDMAAKMLQPRAFRGPWRLPDV